MDSPTKAGTVIKLQSSPVISGMFQAWIMLWWTPYHGRHHQLGAVNAIATGPLQLDYGAITEAQKH